MSYRQAVSELGFKLFPRHISDPFRHRRHWRLKDCYSKWSELHQSLSKRFLYAFCQRQIRSQAALMGSVIPHSSVVLVSAWDGIEREGVGECFSAFCKFCLGTISMLHFDVLFWHFQVQAHWIVCVQVGMTRLTVWILSFRQNLGSPQTMQGFEEPLHSSIQWRTGKLTLQKTNCLCSREQTCTWFLLHASRVADTNLICIIEKSWSSRPAWFLILESMLLHRGN